MQTTATNVSSTTAMATEERPKVIIDLMAGSFAGLTSTICGHPLDTIKVRMQVLNHRFWTCIKTIFQQEGMSSFYRGVQSPLLSTPITTAVSFCGYELSKKLLGINQGDKILLGQGMSAGAMTGFIFAAFNTPVELMKCKLQIQTLGQRGTTNSLMKLLGDTVRQEGVRGLYRGHLVACLRDIPGGALQFGAYEMYKGYFQDAPGASFIAGGLSRLTTWVFCYPQDLIKTRMQCLEGNLDAWTCAKDVWRNHGFRGFFRGAMPSLMKTVMSGALTFTVYEEARKALTSF